MSHVKFSSTKYFQNMCLWLYDNFYCNFCKCFAKNLPGSLYSAICFNPKNGIMCPCAKLITGPLEIFGYRSARRSEKISNKLRKYLRMTYILLQTSPKCGFHLVITQDHQNEMSDTYTLPSDVSSSTQCMLE